MTEQNTRLGIGLMVLTTCIFALQDGISRHLAEHYSVLMVVMIRYWFFAAFVIAVAARQAGGLAPAIRSRFPVLQVLRGLLLAAEVCVMVVGFVKLGLVASHAVFICYPLLVAALSGPVLGETVGWRRWLAIGAGFVGILIILQPGLAVFSPWALVPLAAATLFATYALLTRYVARGDSAAVSFFWTGTVGAVAMTAVGLWHWEPMAPGDWFWMAALCCTAALGHWCLIRAYEVAEASAVQPFAYLQLPFAAMLGFFVFDERPGWNVVLGAAWWSRPGSSPSGASRCGPERAPEGERGRPVEARMGFGRNLREAHGAEGRLILDQLDPRLEFERRQPQRPRPVLGQGHQHAPEALPLQRGLDRHLAEVERCGRGVRNRQATAGSPISQTSASRACRAMASGVSRWAEEGGSIRPSMKAKARRISPRIASQSSASRALRGIMAHLPAESCNILGITGRMPPDQGGSG